MYAMYSWFIYLNIYLFITFIKGAKNYTQVQVLQHTKSAFIELIQLDVSEKIVFMFLLNILSRSVNLKYGAFTLTTNYYILPIL